jgi:hypothetical protein
MGAGWWKKIFWQKETGWLEVGRLVEGSRLAGRGQARRRGLAIVEEGSLVT